MGSFWCVVAERLPQRINFWSDRSRCPHCHQQLAFYDLVPLLSFGLLRGKCRQCHGNIPWLSFFAEWIYGGFLLYLFTYPKFTLANKLTLLVWLTMAFVLSLADWLYQLIDPFLLYPFTIALWLVQVWNQAPFSWLRFFLFLGLYLYGERHWHFIGNGDLILFFLWFPWLSWQQIHLLLFIASGVGIVYYCFLRYIKKRPSDRLPFVPFLSIGLTACLLF